MPEQAPIDLSELLIPTVRRTSKSIGAYIEACLQSSDSELTLRQFVLLHYIQQGCQSQSVLANITERDKGSLTRLIQSVERKQCIRRVPDQSDRRANIVEITTIGRQKWTEASLVVRAAFDRLSAPLTADEQSQLKSLSQRVMTQANHLLHELSLHEQ